MLHSLNTANSGLIVAKAQVENVMNNIANENTKGYKKRVVGVSEASHVDARLTGRGALVGDTTRVTNVYLYDNMLKEDGKKSQYDELSNMLADIESIFYETDDSGFSSDMDRYFQSVEDLRSNPANEIYKNNVKNAGNIIVDDLKTLYSSIEDREVIAKNNINTQAEELNATLNSIGEVNALITNSISIPNDLFDKRDQLEQKLSEYIDISIDRTNGYELEIAGLTAVRFDSNIHELKVITDKVSQKDVYEISDYDKSFKFILNNTTELSSATYTNVDSMITAINNNANGMSNTITASKNDAGNLVITSDKTGDAGKFDFRVLNTTNKTLITKDSDKSIDGIDDVHFEIFDKKLTLKSGSLKSMVDNIDTASSNNLFTSYKNRLDNLANALSDMANSYIENNDGTYISGSKASEVNVNSANTVSIGLFSGSNVNNLSFNDGAVSGLSAKKLEYLSSLQWNKDIDFDGTGNNNTSFSKYNQTLKVKIAEDKENIDFKKETQDAITQSLQATYDKQTKVDKDEEMINLIKFQSAYEANAKLITILDEMLNTILGMKR